MFCPKCGADVGEKSFCTRCGAPVSAEAIEKVGSDAPALPMKWFKFLIWFALFASAVINGLTGLSMLTGGQYDGLAVRVYAVFKDLKTVDVLFGILAIGIAGLAIYTRFRLAGFYKNGPALVIALYVANFVYGLAYAMAVDAATHGLVDGESQIINIITSIVMVIVTVIYFKKRKHLFVK